MLLMPPGSAKSTYGSVVFPSKYLGEQGGRKLILTSYGSDLARKMGRRTRFIIRQPRYQRIWNCSLSPDSQAADQFSLTNGSEYLASGILAGITGNRAHGAIIDDPLSGREAAQSETIRNKTWDAYNDDLLTRLVPGGWLVMILTRWDVDDPAGRILPDDWNGESGYFKCKDGMMWRVLSLQARCESHTDPLGRQLGQYLWPEWFDRQHWALHEADPMKWNSLFQQRPRPIEGSFFTEDLLLIDGKPLPMPHLVDCVFAIIDTAAKTGKKHDGTGVVFFSFTRYAPVAKLVVLDWDYQQIQGGKLYEWLPQVFARLEELSELTHARLGSMGVHIEDKGTGTVLIQQAQNAAAADSSSIMSLAQPIDSALSAMGKSERGIDAEPYVRAGDVKICEEAYHKVVKYKASTKNHFLSQVLGFLVGSEDTNPDDLFDCFCYGVILSLGNKYGF